MDTITLDLAAVPKAARDELGRSLSRAINAYFAQPGAEEKFQAWYAEYIKRPKSQEAG